MDPNETHHGCAVDIGGKGVLITGKSGSGKTSLALGLIERAPVSAALVADDRVILEVDGKTLVARPPATLAGKVELRGFGITDILYRKKTQVVLVVSLVADEELERIPDSKGIEVAGVSLPFVEVPQRHEELAVRIVLAKLGVHR